MNRNKKKWYVILLLLWFAGGFTKRNTMLTEKQWRRGRGNRHLPRSGQSESGWFARFARPRAFLPIRPRTPSNPRPHVPQLLVLAIHLLREQGGHGLLFGQCRLVSLRQSESDVRFRVFDLSFTAVWDFVYCGNATWCYRGDADG